MAQNIGMGTNSPDPSAILELKTSNKGFLPPRMTTSERDAISSPVEGLMLYNTDNSCIQFYNGTNWSGCLGEQVKNSVICNTKVLNGIYIINNALTNLNNISITFTVNVIEPYTISTDTINGYYFYASGVFSTIGLDTIVLTGYGTPTVGQTDNFSLSYNNNACNIPVVVNDIKPNCLAWYNAGQTTDGIYTIDPDGIGGNAPFDCLCDMTTDGGGWTKIFTQDSSDISYLNIFNPSNATWQQNFNINITWNVNNWSTTGDYIIDFNYSKVKYSWIPGRYDNSGLGSARVEGSSNVFLSKVDAQSANSQGQTVVEDNSTICNNCTTNYTTIRSGIINSVAQTQLKVRMTDYLNYYYNYSQVKELWVK